MKNWHVLILCAFCTNLVAQNDAENLEKYWHYRDRLRKSFIKIGGLADGESVPMDIRNHDNLCIPEGTTGFEGQRAEINWGDATIRLGYYIGVLATEYRLLRDNGWDVTATLNELYYALNGVNRLDLNAEFYLSNGAQDRNLNGFLLRDDVPREFADNWKDELKDPSGLDDCLDSDAYPVGQGDRHNADNAESLDQFLAILVNLSLVNKLVDNVFVKPTPADEGFRIIDEVKAISDRMITYINRDNLWQIRNHANRVVKNGPDVLFMSYPVSVAGSIINPGRDYSTEVSLAIRVCSLLGCLNGKAEFSTNSTAFGWDLLGRQDVEENLCIPVLPIIGLPTFVPGTVVKAEVKVKFLFFTITDTISTVVRPNGAIQLPLSICAKVFDDVNKHLVLEAVAASGIWEHDDMARISQKFGMEFFELMYSVLHDKPSRFLDVMRDRLNAAPCDGPFCVNPVVAGGVPAVAKGWSSAFLWNSPTNVAKETCEEPFDGFYNGIDYLIGHNLYYILKNRQAPLPPFEERYSCQCVEEKIPQSVSILTTPEVIRPKFSDYLTKKIPIPEYLAHELTVKAGGSITTEADYVICNNTTILTLENGGMLRVAEAVTSRVIVQDGAVLLIEGGGLAEVGSGATGIILVKSGGTLRIGTNGTLKVFDGSSVIIEPGAILLYEQGAGIQLLGPEAVLEIGGDLALDEDAVFTFTHPGHQGGYIRINAPPGGVRVIALNNSRIQLAGSGKTDKVLEIANGYLSIDKNLSLLRISNGLVEFNRGLGIISPTATQLIGTAFTSADKITHPNDFYPSRGIMLSGNKGLSVINCSIEKVPLVASLAKDKGTISIQTSTITDNGLFINGGGFRISGLDITGGAFSAQGIELPSFYTDGNVIGVPNNNGIVGSSMNGPKIRFERVNVQGAGNGGVIWEGSAVVSMRCGSVTGNFNGGITTMNDAYLDLSTLPFHDAGNVDISGNVGQAIAVEYSDLYINGGYNDLSSAVGSGSRLLARVNTYGVECANPPIRRAAHNNKWRDATKFAGIGQRPGDVEGISTDCGKDVDFIDNSPAGPQECSSFPDPCAGIACLADPLLNCPDCIRINTQDFADIPLNEAVQATIESREVPGIVNGGDDIAAIDLFHQILTYVLANPSNDKDAAFLFDLANREMRQALSNTFLSHKITVEDNVAALHPSVQKVIDIQDSIVAHAVLDGNAPAAFFANMNKAGILRLAGRLDEALLALDASDVCLQTDEHRAFLQRCRNHIEAELRIATGDLSLVEANAILPLLNLAVTSLDSTATAHPSADIGRSVTVGDGSEIGANTSVGDNVQIGSRVAVAANVEIGRGTSVGDSTVIEANVNIGKDCRIGSNVVIKTGATIGDKAVIDDGASVGIGGKIGNITTVRNDVLIGNATAIGDGSYIGSFATIGFNNRIGSNVIIRDSVTTRNNVEIGDGSLIGTGALLNNNAKAGAGTAIGDGSVMGTNSRLCDGESLSSDVGTNKKIGACTQPSKPSPPFSPEPDECFVLSHAVQVDDIFSGIRIEGDSLLCAGAELRFKPALSSVSYFWDFGDCNTSADASPAHVYDAAGVYVVTLVQDFGCRVAKTVSAITILPLVEVSFAALSEPGCENTGKFSFEKAIGLGNFTPPCSSQAGSCSSSSEIPPSRFGIRFNWDFGTSGIPSIGESFALEELSNLDSLIALEFPAGTFTVRLTAILQYLDLTTGVFADAGCISRFTDTIVIPGELSAQFSATITCLRDKVIFTNTTSGGSPDSLLLFAWNFGDGEESDERNPVHLYEEAGSYTVTLIAGDALTGCQDTFVTDITVPLCPLGVVFNNPACGGGPAAGVEVSPVLVLGEDTVVLSDFEEGFSRLTDENGQFFYSSDTLEVLGDASEDGSFSFATVSGLDFEDAEFKTAQEWLDDAPAAFTLATVSEDWARVLTDPPGMQNNPDLAFISSATAIDIHGHLFVTGFINSGPDAGGGFGTFDSEYITIALGTDGDTLWVRKFGTSQGGNGSAPLAITANDSCQVHVTGFTTVSSSSSVITTIKYDAQGNELWTQTYTGGGNINVGYDIALDANDNVYVTGASEAAGTGGDIVTIKYDGNGNQQWAQRFNGTANGFDQGNAIEVSGSRIYVTGFAQGASTGRDFATLAYDNTGTLLWGKTYNGTANGTDFAVDLATDPAGNIIITGNSHETGNNFDITTIQYDPDGNQLWKQSFHTPGSDFDEVFDLAADHNGNVYLTGSSGTGLSAIPDVVASTGSLDFDMLTLKYDSDGGLVWSRYYDGAAGGLDVAYGIVADSAGNVYITGVSQGFSTIPEAASFAFGVQSTGFALAFGSGSVATVDFDPDVAVGAGGSFADAATTIRYDENGNEVWIQTFGDDGEAPDAGFAIALGEDNSVYVAGFTDLSKMLTVKYAQCGDAIANGAAKTTGPPPIVAEKKEPAAQELDKLNEASMVIYPNPARDGTINIAFRLETNEVVTLEIMDMSGRVLVSMANDLPMGEGVYVIPVSTSSLHNGLYMARLKTGSMSAVSRLAVLK